MPGQFGESRWSSERERRDARNSAGPRQPRRSWREGSDAQSADAPVSPIQPEPTAASDRGESATVGSKWRSRGPELDYEGPALPELPGGTPPPRRRSGQIGIIAGAVLLLLVAALMFSQMFPFGDPDTDPTQTPQAPQATNDTQQVEAQQTIAATLAPAQTVESDFLVCIDPGHGGWDPGRERMDMSRYQAPWANEADLNLSMAFFLRDELERRGIAVVMTRETGTAVNVLNDDVNGNGRVLDDTAQGQQEGLRDELQARINVCNDAGADILISIHLNGFDTEAASGYQIFYTAEREFGAQNLDLGNYLNRSMATAFDELGYAANPRGVTADLDLDAQTTGYGSERHLIMIGPEVNNPDYTILPSAMPGVVVETLFLTNTDDARFIVNPDNQRRIAAAWADGIEQYREKYPGNGGQ